MPNIYFPKEMQDYAEAQIKAGIYTSFAEVVRSGIRRLMDEDGASAFYALRSGLREAANEPTIEVNLHELFHVAKA